MKSEVVLNLNDGDNPEIVCRRLLLNTLTRHGRYSVELMVTAFKRHYGIERDVVMASARWFNCTTEMRDGKAYWRKHKVLVSSRRWYFQDPRAATG